MKSGSAGVKIKLMDYFVWEVQMRIMVLVLLNILLHGCANQSQTDSGQMLIKISPRLSTMEIKAQILELTPLGSTVEEVSNFIDHKLFRRIHHENKSVERLPIMYLTSDRQLEKAQEAEWWPKDKKIGGTINAPIDYYGFLPKKVVVVTWYFDTEQKLVAVLVFKGTGAT